MIIISQNGNKITNNVNLRIVPKYNIEGKIIAYEIIGDKYFVIGEYSTEEKCRAILEYIAINGETQRFFKLPKEMEV